MSLIEQKGEYIFYNGTIYTMEQENEKVEAVLVKDGVIVKTGALDDVLALETRQTVPVDLGGKTMLPAFVDAHSHIFSYAQTMTEVNLTGVRSKEEIMVRLKTFIESEEIAPGGWVIGFGYDQNDLAGGLHPTKKDLDAVSEGHPILISHISGHMGVLNTLAMEVFGVTEAADGYLEEGAFMRLSSAMAPASDETLLKNLQKAQAAYASYGIATAQEALANEKSLPALLLASQEEKLWLDVVCYVDMKNCRGLYLDNQRFKTYQNRLRLGGYKLILDGSPQGKTAWLSRPYEGEKSYRGRGAFTDGELCALLAQANADRAQVCVHANGDAASGQMLSALGAAGYDAALRPVMIHAQTATKGQLCQMPALGVIPSFFVAHTYYFGDTHVKNLGLDRAGAISPAKSAFDLGLCPTFHQDTPVLAPNMLETIWCAVCRQTKTGRVLGEGERISVYQAVSAVTKNAAFALFEENQKGTIALGKRADFAVLSDDPFTVLPEEIKDISVVATVKDGGIVYQKSK